MLGLSVRYLSLLQLLIDGEHRLEVGHVHPLERLLQKQDLLRVLLELLLGCVINLCAVIVYALLLPIDLRGELPHI